MRNLYNILILLIFSTLYLHAQDIAVNAEYPSVVYEGQQFNITWTINSRGGEFQAPSFGEFYKLMGPQISFSSSTQNINGKRTSNISNSYSYYLQAPAPGKYVIAPATYKEKHKTYSSDSIHIEVIAGNSAPQGSGQSAHASSQPASTAAAAGNGNVFVELQFNKREVYIGEPVTATAKLFTKINLSGINEINYPSFSGFIKTDIETPPLSSLNQENINGTIYGTGAMQKFLLYPQKTGEITIDPMQVTVLQRKKISSGMEDSFFGDFFSSYQDVPVKVVSKPVKIKVKPLPGTRPADFSGIVGKLKMAASINKDSVNVNDAITLKIVVSGTGNLKLAGNPVLKLSPDIEQYDPKISDNIKNSAGGSSGTKTFEYILIPRHYGNFTIPSISYSYFNTSTEKYEHLSTPAFSFYAKKTDDQQTSGLTVYGGLSKEDVKYVGKDIRFMKPNAGKLFKPSNMIVKTKMFYSFYGLAIILFLAIMFIRREHVRLNADITAVKNRKAGKAATKRLRVAAEHLKNNNMDNFYEDLLKALSGYLSDKLMIPVSELNRTNIVDTLKNKNIDEEEINILTDIIDTCEYARYAPSKAEAEATSVYDKAVSFIKFLENHIS